MAVSTVKGENMNIVNMTDKEAYEQLSKLIVEIGVKSGVIGKGWSAISGHSTIQCRFVLTSLYERLDKSTPENIHSDQRLANVIHKMFTSLNDVPVERITLTRQQYEALLNRTY